MTFALPSRACRVEGCPELVQHPRRFCEVHWSRVPTDLQNQIADTWAEARAAGGSSTKWHEWGKLVMEAAKLVENCP